MARYFSDLDNGKTKYIDSVGTELADVNMVPSEAIGFLTAIAKDVRDDSDLILVVSVRDEIGQVIFTTTLTLQSDWLVEAAHVTRPPHLSFSSWGASPLGK
jgi:hypothetical protein